MLYFLRFCMVLDGKCCISFVFDRFSMSNVVLPWVLIPEADFWSLFDAKCWRLQIPSSCGRLLFNSYATLIQILSWLPFLLLWSWLVQFWFKTDPYPLMAGMPPPVVASCSILVQSWSKSFVGCRASSCGRFLFMSRSEKKQSLPVLPWLLLWSFFIQNWYKIPHWLLDSSRGRFLFNSWSKALQNHPLAALVSLAVVFYSNLNRKWCKILLWLPKLLLWSFLFHSQ